MRTRLGKLGILAVVMALLFSLTAAPVVLGAALPEDAADVQGEDEADIPEGEEADNEPGIPDEVLEKVHEVLERIDEAFQKCLDALNHAVEQAAEQAREALTLAIRNVEKWRERITTMDQLVNRDGPFADRPSPAEVDGDNRPGDNRPEAGELVPPQAQNPPASETEPGQEWNIPQLPDEEEGSSPGMNDSGTRGFDR